MSVFFASHAYPNNHQSDYSAKMCLLVPYLNLGINKRNAWHQQELRDSTWHPSEILQNCTALVKSMIISILSKIGYKASSFQWKGWTTLCGSSICSILRTHVLPCNSWRVHVDPVDTSILCIYIWLQYSGKLKIKFTKSVADWKCRRCWLSNRRAWSHPGGQSKLSVYLQK